MECITIGSESDESEIEFVCEKKLEQAISVTEEMDFKLLTPQIRLMDETEPMMNKKDNFNNKLKIKEAQTVKIPRRVDLIQIIEIQDDDNDTDSGDTIDVSVIMNNGTNVKHFTPCQNNKSELPIPEDPIKIDENETRIMKNEFKMDEKLRLNTSNDILKDDDSLDKPSSSTEKPFDTKDAQSTGNVYSSQIGFNLLDNIVLSCKMLDLGPNLIKNIEYKIKKYASVVSKETMKNEKTIELLRTVNKEINALAKSGELENDERLLVIDNIKKVLNELKNDGRLVDKKLNFLYHLFNKLKKRIEKLEEMEVESDDEMENPYVLLGRYRTKATEVYKKICELEGKAPHADRQYLQRFTYSGKGPIQVQRALELYYNTTRKFPNFKDVLKITNKVNEEKKLKLSSSETYEIAQQMFTDFGKKLKLRRQLDDYHILVGYISEGQKDPAVFDQTLKTKLDHNKDVWKKKENEIIDLYAKKQVEKNSLKRKGINSKDEQSKSDGESEDSASMSDTESDEDDKSEDSKLKRQDFSDSDEELDKILDDDINGPKQNEDTDCNEFSTKRKRNKIDI